METFSYYLVTKKYDEMNKRKTSAAVRTDGPIRVNSFGTVDMDRKFIGKQKRVDYYLIYMIEGEMTFYLKGEEREFKAGDFVILPPYFDIHYEKKNEDRLVYYLAHFSGTDVERFLNSLNLNVPEIFSVGMVEKVVETFYYLFDSYAKNLPCIQEIVSAGLQEILIELSLKAFEPEAVCAPWNAVYYVKRHLTDKITVPMLAKLEGLSESRFYALFKEIMGVAPIEYVNDLRVERACNLLTSSLMSCSEIGESCGFYDNFYFSKIFKKKMGVTPTEYKKKMLKSGEKVK